MWALIVQGLPGDDFPGIPGAPWGIGSRVVLRDWFGAEVRGMIRGATTAHSPEGWEFHVALEGHPRDQLRTFRARDVLRLALSSRAAP